MTLMKHQVTEADGWTFVRESIEKAHGNVHDFQLQEAIHDLRYLHQGYDFETMDQTMFWMTIAKHRI